MSRIFITGSADGLGQLSATALIKRGHQVVLHARNAARAKEAKRKVPGVDTVLTGDLSIIDEIKMLAQEVNTLGLFDAIIHNAGVYQVPSKTIFTVNTLAPYILTGLISRPKRLVYLSSGMHLQGRFNESHFTADSNNVSYSDSKLHVVMLSMAVARKWPGVYSNSVDPGWVPTKMGGSGAPDDLQKGFETQAWLAVSNDENAKAAGQYFHHKKVTPHNVKANDVALQDKFLLLCKEITGISFPE